MGFETEPWEEHVEELLSDNGDGSYSVKADISEDDSVDGRAVDITISYDGKRPSDIGKVLDALRDGKGLRNLRSELKPKEGIYEISFETQGYHDFEKH